MNNQKFITYRNKHRQKLNEKARINYIPSIRKNRYERDRERLLHNIKVYVRKEMSIILWHYSNGTYRCACCRLKFIKDFLDIDHLNGNGNQHRKSFLGMTLHHWLIKNNLPKGYQVLCSLCNQGKRRNGGVCPHNDPNQTELIYISSENPNMIPFKNRIN